MSGYIAQVQFVQYDNSQIMGWSCARYTMAHLHLKRYELWASSWPGILT